MDWPSRRTASIAKQPLRDAHDVSLALTRLLGEDPAAARGVIHVAACFRARDGLLHVLKVGPAAPQSPSDFFLLQATRARAEAIVTTAEILRSEPTLSHLPRGDHAAALRAYRRACLGDERPLQIIVLTRSGQLPRDHPAFHEATQVRVLAPPTVAPGLAAALGVRVQVEPWAANSVGDVIARLRSEGLQTISIEAGPRTARELYEGACLADEVCMSIYEGAEVGEAAQGGALPADASLFAGLARQHADAVVDEASGRFRFMRWVRAHHEPSGVPSLH